jgi:hypothetical protein
MRYQQIQQQAEPMDRVYCVGELREGLRLSSQNQNKLNSAAKDGATEDMAKTI